MRFSTFAIVVLWGSGASADPGHLIEVAGHGHWLAAGAIGAAIVIGIWGAVKGRPAKDDADAESEEPQEV